MQTYLQEEVLQEGLTRNLSAFSRFLEIASFSQGEVLNISEVARESSINRKVVENYYNILEDLLIARRVPIFNKKQKRKLIAHSKFYYFDVGVYRTLRPQGPLDHPEGIDGAALETLVLQELSAHIDAMEIDYKIYYWRTCCGKEVDFILYGNAGLMAIEVKRKKTITIKDLGGLRSFREDYPIANCFVFYGGDSEKEIDGIHLVPLNKVFVVMENILQGKYPHF